MIRTSNKNAHFYIKDKKEFKGNHTFAVNDGILYIIYSYGRHFPMYVYNRLTNVWLANKDKYSRTTSKHQSQLRPNRIDEYVSIDELQRYIDTCIN